MKLRSLMLLLLTISAITAFSKADPPGDYGVKKINVPAFTRIRLDANIDVMLYQDDQDGPVFLDGAPRYFDEIKVSVVNGELRVSSNKARFYKGKISIGIPVHHLERLQVNGNGQVVTSNKLKTDKLSVIMNAPCNLSLASTGKIVFYTPEDYDFAYHKLDHKQVEFLPL